MNQLPASITADAPRRISSTITRLLNSQPFFGSLALRMPQIPHSGVQTIATDGTQFFFNSDWVAQADSWELDCCIARLVFACSLKHHTRRKNRNPEVWQQASQAVTHPMLADCGFQIPPRALHMPDHSIEEAYLALIKDMDPQGQPSQASGKADQDDKQESSPDESSGKSAQSAPEASSDENDKNAGSDSGSGENAPQGDSGPYDGDQPGSDSPYNAEDGDLSDENSSAANQSANRPESGVADPGGTGTVLDAPMDAQNATSDDDRAIKDAEQNWDKATHQAAAFARAQGRMTGRMSEHINNQQKSTLDWRALLRKYATEASDSDVSWATPSRRFIAEGLYLPGPHSEDDIESLVIAIDTSISVDTPILARIWSELHAFTSEFDPDEIHVLQADTCVTSHEVYGQQSMPSEIDVKGRGGTDFAPTFVWLAKRGITPKLFLYISDMYCTSYPGIKPHYPVIWLNWSPPLEEICTPPFGEVIPVQFK